MSDDGYYLSNVGMAIHKPENPWARISEIAARVGVKPGTPAGTASILATGADGQSYDIMAVVRYYGANSPK